MRVIFCKPDKFASVINVDFDSIYAVLDCSVVQVVYPWDDTACIICDDDGKLTGKALCRALRDEDGDIYDIVAGAFLIAGLGDEDFKDLTDAQVAYYWRKFYRPELFVRSGDAIMALPYDGFADDEEEYGI